MTKSIDITMPSLGADMTEGMLVEWLIKVGDRVKQGDVIAVLETQKGAIDMEVYHDGIITQLLVKPLKTVDVGTVLATIGGIATKKNTAEESPNESKQRRSIVKQVTTEQIIDDRVLLSIEPLTDKQLIKPRKSHTQKLNISTYVNTVLASPVVRKIAKSQQLDLSAIQGSGSNGAVILKDIAQITQKSLLTDGDLLTNMRSAISAGMTKSKQEIPHFYLSLDVPINKAQQWLQQSNYDKTPKEHILLIALLLKAIAITLRKYPSLNGFYRNNRFEQANEINIANVISLRTGGVVVPALLKVEQLSVPEIMFSVRDMTSRSRAIERGERLRSSELMNATITITNMGERGADRVFGIIYPPQVAIIGFGKVNKVPQVCGDYINVGEQLTVCLSADHRVVDGMLAAKFLNSLAKILQKPGQL